MIDVFAAQARLSATRGLPLVVHTREAEDDTLRVLRDCVPRDHKVHVHAFQGSVGMMRETLEMLPNCVFGVSGMLTLAWPPDCAIEIGRRSPRRSRGSLQRSRSSRASPSPRCSGRPRPTASASTASPPSEEVRVAEGVVFFEQAE